MLMSSLNTAAVTTVQLIPTTVEVFAKAIQATGSVALTTIGAVGTVVQIADRSLEVADVGNAKWARIQLQSYAYDEKGEGEAAINAAALRMASAEEALERTLQANPPLAAKFAEKKALLSA